MHATRAAITPRHALRARTPALLLLAALAAGIAGAESRAAAAPAARSGPEAAFAKGTWIGYTYGSTVFLDDDHGTISTAHVGGGYYFDDAFSFNLELLGGGVNPIGDDQGGVAGLDALFRWHFARGKGWSLYVDGGAGIQQATTNFPSDSHHNFRPQGGVGLTWRIGDRWRVMGGARFLHISNGGTTDRNDGGDWAQVYAGLMVDF